MSGVIRREDAERFVEEVHGDDPEVAAKLRIEERELAGATLGYLRAKIAAAERERQAEERSGA